MLFLLGNLRERARRLASPIRRMEYAGVQPRHDARAAKHILLANRLALSYLLIAAPYYFVFMLAGMEILAWSLFPIFAWLAVTFFLNAKGWSKLARISLASNMSVSIAFFAIALGRGAGAQMLLLAATLNFLILFDWERERIPALAGLLLNSALFLGYQALDFRSGALYALSRDVEQPLRLAISVAASLVLIAGVLHLVIQNARVERELIAAREKAQAADRIKSRFIANMSHEIRTPLNVILGSTQLLEKPGSGAKRMEFLSNIRTSANDLLAILNDVLDLSKIEAGKLNLESTPFGLPELAEMAVTPLLPQAARKGLDLRLDADTGSVGTLRGDSSMLRQILANLLSNALKFTPGGSVVLRIRRAGGEDSRPLIRFEVEDTGVGISEDAQKNLFQPFRQADDSSTRTFGGSGLGLAICKGLIERLGGSIRLTSRLGAGTTVSFTIPFEVDAGPGLAEQETAPRSASHPAGNPGVGKPGDVRVLIVEDHPFNRVVLQGMLQAQGFGADEAIDGRQALEAFSARPYDLILMDCHMPNMDGIECTRRIRALGGRRPIIIGITADALIETRRNCLEAGMDRVLLKPLEEKDLRNALLHCTAAGNAEDPKAPEPEVPVLVNIPRLTRLIQETRLREPGHRKKALEQFEADVQALRLGLGEAARSGSPGKLKDSAHGLKGLCRTLGLDRLADTCKQIESISLTAGSPDWSPVMSDLETVFESSLEELRRVMKA